MGFFRSGTSSKTSVPSSSSNQEYQQAKTLKQEAILTIPSCTVHLMEQGEAMELLPSGEFTLLRILDKDVPLVTIIKVSDELQWPLTKDEPVVKLDSLHYLFTLPVKDADPLSYGVTFSEKYRASLSSLDTFLRENSCFSDSSATSSKDKHIDWKDFAPRIEDYNNVLAKAIAGGTGQIIKGIFKCSNAYTNQVQQGGDMIISRAAVSNNITNPKYSNGNSGTTNKSAINRSLKRVRRVSKMTEEISKTMLDGVQLATGSVMTPMVKSQAGKAFLAMVPGEVLLASLDAVNKVLDATEAAEKQSLSATSKAATSAVSNRFGENAGEATEDVLATAGHCAGTAWNVFKIRKAINPATSVSSGTLKSAAEVKKSKSSKF